MAVPPVCAVGSRRRGGLRSPAALPGALSPLRRRSGRRLYPGGGGGRLRLFAAAGRGRAAVVHAGGGAWRGGAVCGGLLGASAAGMAVLGRRPGGTGAFGAFAHPKPGGPCEKFIPPWKKPLLFCPQMLYNKENRVSGPISQRRRQAWQNIQQSPKRPEAA